MATKKTTKTKKGRTAKRPPVVATDSATIRLLVMVFTFLSMVFAAVAYANYM